MGAADPRALHHGVRPRRAEPQRQLGVPHSVHVRPVGHGPFVQPEAPQPRRPLRRARQQLPGERGPRRAVRQERRHVHGPAAHLAPLQHDAGRLARLDASPVLPLASGRRAELGGLGGGRGAVAVRQNDAGARVPALQRRGGVGVVAEQEVLHGVLLAAHAQGHQRVGAAGDALAVGPGASAPGPGCQDSQGTGGRGEGGMVRGGHGGTILPDGEAPVSASCVAA